MIKKVLKKTGKSFVSPMKKSVEFFKTDLKEIKKNNQSIVSGYKNLFSGFSDRSRKDQDRINRLNDFRFLLAVWDIEPEEISQVIKALYVRAFAYLFLGILGLSFIVFSSGFQFIAGIILSVLGIFAFLASMWRARVLQNEQFISFSKWILGYKIK